MESGAQLKTVRICSVLLCLNSTKNNFKVLNQFSKADNKQQELTVLIYILRIQAFPNLEKLTVNHPKFITMNDKQIWPENLTKLTIYNTNTEVMPLIKGSRIQALTIQNWKHLRHSIQIRTVRPKAVNEES